MISLQDCLALCDLTPDEVAAIGEHEHVPEIIATSLGSYLIHGAHGAEGVRDMICRRHPFLGASTRHLSRAAPRECLAHLFARASRRRLQASRRELIHHSGRSL